ncbi:MAG: hypothetical protein ABSF81_00820 [Bacteroidales bacterium]
MGHKNDYSVTVFFLQGKPKKWTFVHSLDGFANFLNKNHSEWSYMNIYDRRKGQYLKRFYKGNVVPDFL